MIVDPRVSVVMSVRDGERYLAEALESILGQSVRPGEIIAVDDGSTDGTFEILDRYASRVRVLRRPPLGIATALNQGIVSSGGALIAFLDSDDAWLPDSLACRLARIDEPDEPEAVCGQAQQFVSPELDPARAARFRFDPAPHQVALFGTMLIRRTAMDRVGPLDPTYVTASNIDWVARAQSAGLRMVEVPDVVLRRRLHDTNIGVTMAGRKRSDLVDIVRAHRRRQRPDGSGATG
jgi:glycosyltransferase involved in cell wall biosynthesis